MLQAMTRHGWVDGAKLIFQATRRTGDYHGQMNFENFRRWFGEQLLPQIPAASLIVRDTAPYPNVYLDGMFYPTTWSKQAELPRWLQHHPPEAYDDSMIKAERLALCRQGCPQPDDELERIALAAGHQMLRPPPYHPELQPIEEGWGVVKNHCAEKCDDTLAGLRRHLEEGVDKVTPETCRAAIADRRREEDRSWQEDMEELDD
jgi:hypothetical protein